jgi:epoxyqueuosine reductase
MSIAPLRETSTRSALAQAVKAEANRLLFDLCGIAPAVGPTGLTAFQDWLSRDYAGEMSYLPGRKDAYTHPRAVLENVRSIVMVALNYRTETPPEPGPGQARVSRYAWGSRDYHDVIR